MNNTVSTPKYKYRFDNMNKWGGKAIKVGITYAFLYVLSLVFVVVAVKIAGGICQK